MRTINFTRTAFKEYNSWRNENRKLQDRIAELIEDFYDILLKASEKT